MAAKGLKRILGKFGMVTRTLTLAEKAKVASEIKMLLHAHRDCLRNLARDTKQITFDVRDGYYGEAFGILRALVMFGYMEYGGVNTGGTAQGWMAELQQEVLEEEGFGGSGKCDFCY